MISSYGVNGRQAPAKRVEWLNAIHEIFDQHGLSACYFSYKHDYAPSDAVDPNYGIFRQANKGPVTVADPSVLQAMEAYWSRPPAGGDR